MKSNHLKIAKIILSCRYFLLLREVLSSLQSNQQQSPIIDGSHLTWYCCSILAILWCNHSRWSSLRASRFSRKKQRCDTKRILCSIRPGKICMPLCEYGCCFFSWQVPLQQSWSRSSAGCLENWVVN